MKELIEELQALQAIKKPTQLELNRIAELEDMIMTMKEEEANAEEEEEKEEDEIIRVVVNRCNTTRTRRAFIVNGLYVISVARMRAFGILYDWQMMRQSISGTIGATTATGLHLFNVQELSNMEKFEGKLKSAMASKLVEEAFKDEE